MNARDKGGNAAARVRDLRGGCEHINEILVFRALRQVENVEKLGRIVIKVVHHPLYLLIRVTVTLLLSAWLKLFTLQTAERNSLPSSSTTLFTE